MQFPPAHQLILYHPTEKILKTCTLSGYHFNFKSSNVQPSNLEIIRSTEDIYFEFQRIFLIAIISRAFFSINVSVMFFFLHSYTWTAPLDWSRWHLISTFSTEETNDVSHASLAESALSAPDFKKCHQRDSVTKVMIAIICEWDFRC